VHGIFAMSCELQQMVVKKGLSLKCQINPLRVGAWLLIMQNMPILKLDFSCFSLRKRTRYFFESHDIGLPRRLSAMHSANILNNFQGLFVERFRKKKFAAFLYM
jgi:hypothetical protein